ncbi:Bet v I/Major latex protein [Arabidopsis thaliana x Arabidopsis arenosa]|nr:Bet v I/Major latex protein [Arabidopsis thaliana x Arabidopsis arenosa]
MIKRNSILKRHLLYINQGNKCYFIDQNKTKQKKHEWKLLNKIRKREREMATSGTYVTEVPLKGTVEKHFKRYRNENYLFPDTIGHHIQSVTVHDGEWDTQGGIKIWNYTLGDGKEEVFKERREIDDDNKIVKVVGLEGHVMEQFKVYEIDFQFIPKSEEDCVCKITMIWEKRNDDFPEPSSYMQLLKSMVIDMEDHVLKA